MSLLDRIGKLFVYESPPPLDKKTLYTLYYKQYPNWYLKQLLDIDGNYNKSQLIHLLLKRDI